LLLIFDKQNPGVKTEWANKNNWHGEGMLAFQCSQHPMTLTQVGDKIPDYQVLNGLPDYAYDKHTRAGKRAISIMAKHKDIKDFFDLVKSTQVSDICGWALFYAEGCLIEKEMRDIELYDLELKMVAAKFGLKKNDFCILVAAVKNLIPHLNDCRLQSIALDKE